MRCPRSSTYNWCTTLVASSNQAMPMSSVANSARSRSPTTSTMAWKSSLAATPCWMSLTTASSAARCSASGLRGAGVGGALGDLLLEAGSEAQVGQRHAGLAGEKREQIAVGVAEAAERALDVGVEEAEHLVLGQQRRDDARALVHAAAAFGAVTQAGDAAVAGFVEPGRHGSQQR